MAKIRKDSYKPEEIELIKTFYENSPKAATIVAFAKAGFKRSWQSIHVTAKKLGYKRNPDIVRQDMIEAGRRAPLASNLRGWTKPEEDYLRKCYQHSSQDDLTAHLKRTWKAIRERAVKLGLSRDKKAIDKDRAKHLKENLGVDSTWQLESVRKKSRQTNLQKRGVEYPTQSQEVRDKVKATVQKKYGVDNVFQAEAIKRKAAATNLKNLGVTSPQQSPDIQTKTAETNLERYGVTNPFQLTDRVQAGMLEKYGVESPQQHPEIREATELTNFQRYGHRVPILNPQVWEKFETTCLARFGFKTPLQSPAVKDKILATNLERYGVANPMKLEEIKAKIRKANLEKFGVECLLQLKEIRAKGWAVMKKNKSFNKSKPELEFWEHLKALDPATEHHVEHPDIHHIMDFYMPKYDLWVQFDGAYWHGKIQRVNVTRQALKIMKTMARDQYENEHVPNLIRFWDDDTAQAIENGTVQGFIKSRIEERLSSKTFSHQYHKKMEWLEHDLKELSFDPTTLSATDFDQAMEAPTKEIAEFILKYEWLGTLGVYPKWCFTARYNGELAGVILINEPTAYSKLLGKETPKYEALIQRGATSSWAPKNVGSRLIRFACNWMVNNTDKRAFVAYGDPSAEEIGTIYQACGFDYLGQAFGNSVLYRHPRVKGGKIFSTQSLRRTSAFRRWCRQNNITPKKHWFKENEFKNLDSIPQTIKRRWYAYIQKIIAESEKFLVDRKHKYVLVLGKNKADQKALSALKTYRTRPYPKK